MQNPFLNKIFLHSSVFTFLYLIIPVGLAYAQIPQDTPNPDDSVPLDLENPTNIIFFIVLPVLFILLYLWLRWRKNRRK